MFNHFGAILERTTCEVFHGKDGVEKRRRSVIATTPSVPFSQLCKVLKAIGDEVAQPMQLTRCVDDEVNIATPYGNLLVESEIPMAEGDGARAKDCDASSCESVRFVVHSLQQVCKVCHFSARVLREAEQSITEGGIVQRRDSAG